MATSQEKPMDVSYLDVQAAVGITKHMGGFRATNALLTLCHIDTAGEVLSGRKP